MMTFASFAESAPVTQWPMRLLLVGVVLAIIAGVLLAMRRGWRNRGLRQAQIPQPPAAPGALNPRSLGPVGGVYLGSTSAGDWLDRIVVHGLGLRSRALLEAGPQGVLLTRDGAPDVFIPAASLHRVGAGRGIAGRAYGQDGVLILTWDLGGRLIDTGWRADRAADQESAEVAVCALVAADERMG